MNYKKYRYNHLGIPTTKRFVNEKYWPNYDIYISGSKENEFNIQWMKCGPKCTLPKIVQEIPHVGFEVDDIQKAIKGYNVIFGPDNPIDGITIAFVLINDAPIEFIQFT